MGRLMLEVAMSFEHKGELFKEKQLFQPIRPHRAMLLLAGAITEIGFRYQSEPRQWRVDYRQRPPARATRQVAAPH